MPSPNNRPLELGFDGQITLEIGQPKAVPVPDLTYQDLVILERMHVMDSAQRVCGTDYEPWPCAMIRAVHQILRLQGPTMAVARPHAH